MITYKITSNIKLNNRNAFELMGILRDFNGAVFIEKASEKRQANAKSLLGLLSLGIAEEEINIIIDDRNDNAEKLFDKIKNVLKRK